MAAINGAIAYLPNIQTTEDLTYLTPAMGGKIAGVETALAFKKDYADSPNGDWINTYHPYCSDIAKSLISASLTTQITAKILTPVTSGHIAKSFLYDYYFRIHLNTYKVTLGNVLTEQTKYVEIWNAWFNTETLSSVGNVGLSELNIQFNSLNYNPYDGTTGYTPQTIPYTFNALELVQAVLTVPAVGVPNLNGYYTFNFSIESPVLFVTGQRIVLWPYSTLSKFTETRTYLTNVIQNVGTEQRYSLREIPRLTLEYENIFLTDTEFSNAKQIATTIGHLALALPIWTDVTHVVNLVQSQTNIYFNTVSLELRVDYPVLIWKSWDNYEIQEIQTIFPDRITLKEGLDRAYTSCWILPIALGYIDGGIKVGLTEHQRTGNVKITSVDNFYNPVAFTNTFQGLPIWERKAVLTGGVSNTYGREFEVSEVQTGLVTRYDTENYSRQTTKLHTFIESREDLYNVRRTFDYLKGKYQTFFLPSMYSCFNPLSSIVSGTSTLTVTKTELSTYPIKYIYVLGKDSFGNTLAEAFEIDHTIDNFNGTESINFVVAATKTFYTISTVSILLKLRLDSDVVEYTHLGKQRANVNISVKEVL